MRLFLAACLALSACSDSAEQLALETRQDCREAKGRAAYAESLAKSFGQQPDPELQATVDELCGLAQPTGAELVAEAALR